jgi:archaellin
MEVYSMVDSKWNEIWGKLRTVFKMRHTRITLYIAVVLWVAVGAQVIINRAFQEEVQITEAFVKSDTEEMRSSLELIAEYKTGYLNDASKKELIQKLADAIG